MELAMINPSCAKCLVIINIILIILFPLQSLRRGYYLIFPGAGNSLGEIERFGQGRKSSKWQK